MKRNTGSIDQVKSSSQGGEIKAGEAVLCSNKHSEVL